MREIKHNRVAILVRNPKRKRVLPNPARTVDKPDIANPGARRPNHNAAINTGLDKLNVEIPRNVIAPFAQPLSPRRLRIVLNRTLNQRRIKRRIERQRRDA